MDLFEFSTQSFLIKIWVEETAAEAGETLWRGHITHVHSGERQYFQDLEDMMNFMQPYMVEMGITTGHKRPFQRWFHRWRFGRAILDQLQRKTAVSDPHTSGKNQQSPTQADRPI